MLEIAENGIPDVGCAMLEVMEGGRRYAADDVEEEGKRSTVDAAELGVSDVKGGRNVDGLETLEGLTESKDEMRTEVTGIEMTWVTTAYAVVVPTSSSCTVWVWMSTVVTGSSRRTTETEASTAGGGGLAWPRCRGSSSAWYICRSSSGCCRCVGHVRICSRRTGRTVIEQGQQHQRTERYSQAV